MEIILQENNMQFLHALRGRDARLLPRWSQLWAFVLIAPAALAVTSMSLTMAAAAIVASFGLATVTALAMTADSVRALRVQLPTAVRFGACAAVTCLGFAGLFAFSGPLVWPAIAAYTVTAAWAQFLRSTPPGQAAAAPYASDESTAEPPGATADEVRSMTDTELCQAWRRSFVRLMSTDSLGRRTREVTLRQAILDEIEVRHPAGLRAWLDSGARPAGGPDRFLGRSDEVGPHKPPGRAPGTASPPD